MASAATNHLPVYLDECVDHGIVPYLRQRGFTVTTARDAGMLGATDEEQLRFAATRSLVLVSYNRRHFVQLHGDFGLQGRRHAGIALLRPARVRVLGPRAALLVDWSATRNGDQSQLVRWARLQDLLTDGFRVSGYSEDEVLLALGRAK